MASRFQVEIFVYGKDDRNANIRTYALYLGACGWYVNCLPLPSTQLTQHSQRIWAYLLEGHKHKGRYSCRGGLLPVRYHCHWTKSNSHPQYA